MKQTDANPQHFTDMHGTTLPPAGEPPGGGWLAKIGTGAEDNSETAPPKSITKEGWKALPNRLRDGGLHAAPARYVKPSAGWSTRCRIPADMPPKVRRHMTCHSRWSMVSSGTQGTAAKGPHCGAKLVPLAPPGEKCSEST